VTALRQQGGVPVSQQPRTREYALFRILIDDPAEDAALGFPDYADAFAEIIRLTPPRFAIGLLGSWGSDKTTLMRAIEERIESREEITLVWFNAWRYEREEHLIIPLLDVLREALLEWAETNTEHAPNSTIIGRARHAASVMGGAARAIATFECRSSCRTALLQPPSGGGRPKLRRSSDGPGMCQSAAERTLKSKGGGLTQIGRVACVVGRSAGLPGWTHHWSAGPAL
jgi:hypothetical protein